VDPSTPQVPVQVPYLGILKMDLFVNPKLSFDCLIGAGLLKKAQYSLITFFGRSAAHALEILKKPDGIAIVYSKDFNI